MTNLSTTSSTAQTQDSTAPRYAVREERHVRIPMSDGVELDAHLYFPDAEGEFPAVFDYYPYRKDDLSAGNMRNQVYLAERGFVGIRIDVRGTGSSGGVAIDEYTRQEQLDAVEAIAWMAAQPWCNGKVGMFGASYGGFNSLQVAMHRPPALKAICPMYFTDNRYTDDCHYKGGSMQMLYDLATYGLGMVVQNSLPPYPEALGSKWAETWEEHLQAEPWLLTWLSNHVYNDYWRQGSLCEDYAAIECATYLFGGWRDGYTNCNLRAYENLSCPKKVLVGPWLHVSPDSGIPGPRIDHLHEMVRFYNYWLKDEDDGVMDEPPVTIYMQEYDEPAAERDHTSGEWRNEPAWPIADSRTVTHYLGAEQRLVSEAPREKSTTSYAYHPSVGTTFGMFSASSPHILPVDQRLEEAYSLSWTSAPLNETIEIIGHAEVDVHVAVDTDIASLSVRLIDVAPDGTAALVTKGLLNLTHRDSHTDPSWLTPGKVYPITVQLDATAWRFAPGHRLRVSFAGADFPNAWPSPKRYTGTIHSGGEQVSALRLPVVGQAPANLPKPTFRPPTPYTPRTSGFSTPPIWKVSRDHIGGTTSVELGRTSQTQVSERVSLTSSGEATAKVNDQDPAQATIFGRSQVILHWPERTIDTVARAQLESTEDTLHVTIQLNITMDGEPFHQRRWVRSIPRQML